MNITVFCGAKMGTKEIYARKTANLGKWIATNGHQLIYGGGNDGLMGLLADTVLQNKGRVIGIMPGFLIEHEGAHKGLTEFYEVPDMLERKKRLINMADAFIALPGGLGTLEEIADVVSWAKIGQNDKPCVFYNIASYYEPLRQQLDLMVHEGYLGQAQRNNVLFSDSLNEIAEYINNYHVVAEF